MEVLPPELLVEILKMLTWKDVLRARSTCKRLAEATRTRAIWALLIDLHIMDNPQRARLECPVEMYTSSELERHLLFWKSAEIGWDLKEKEGRPARERSFTAVKAEFLHLIKGGRWLLVTDKSGAASYYDLDSETITGVPLIPGLSRIKGYFEISMSIDVDDDSPFLKFNVAFSLFIDARMDPEHPYPRRIVQIWGVSLILDTTHRAIGLTATRLASFPHRSVVLSVGSNSLLGSQLAVGASIANSSYAIVIDWKQANENPLTYAWRVAQSTGYTAVLHLLPQNKLISVGNDVFQLTDYSIIPETSTVPDPSLIASFLLWRQYFIGRGLINVSSPLFAENRILLVWNNAVALFAVDIQPASSIDDVLPFVKLADYPHISQYRKPFFGCTRSAVIESEDGIKVTTYAYLDPGRSSPAAFSRSLAFNLSSEPDMTPAVAVDEASGRIVCPGYVERDSGSEHFIIVADLTLVFKS